MLVSRGLPTALPTAFLFGFRRYERGVFTRGLLSWRAAFIYPTRNFATLGTLVTPSLVRLVARSFLPGSLCRHGGRTVSSPLEAVPRVQSLRIPLMGFLLIVRTGRVVTSLSLRRLVPPDTRMFQHIARFTHGHVVITVIVTAAVYWGFVSGLRRS